MLETITATIDCEYCGRPLSDDEADDPEPEGFICEDCYCEHFHYTCCQCQDCEHVSEQHALVVVFDDFEDDVGVTPGIYTVMKKPYAFQPWIGMGYLHPKAVSYLAPLPTRISDEQNYPCGHLCLSCQQDYTCIGDESE